MKNVWYILLMLHQLYDIYAYMTCDRWVSVCTNIRIIWQYGYLYWMFTVHYQHSVPSYLFLFCCLSCVFRYAFHIINFNGKKFVKITHFHINWVTVSTGSIAMSRTFSLENNKKANKQPIKRSTHNNKGVFFLFSNSIESSQ